MDGTLAETEEAHRTAFNAAFAEAGLTWGWSEAAYRDLLTTTGGRERIARYMIERDAPPDDALVAALHARKNALYADMVASGSVTARPGIPRLIADARRRRVRPAIATTTSRSNLDALLRHVFGSDSPDWFAATIAGEDVTIKKPDPEVYRRALAALECDPAECIAIEDTRNGLDAALAAGLTTVVTPSLYSAHESFRGAHLLVPNLSEVSIDTLDAMLSTTSARP